MTSHSDSDSIGQTAARWFARRDRGLTPAEEHEFARWQEADPRHPAEFARLEKEWDVFGLAHASPRVTATARRFEARARAHAYRRPLIVYGAISVAVAAVAVLFKVATAVPTTSPTYQVIPAAARLLTFSDGTRVELNGQSRVEEDFTAAERRVRLVRGEAYFEVSKNPQRPFVVVAKDVEVRALGTAFNIRLEPAVLEVLVTEGKVEVAGAAALPRAAADPLPLTAGQRATVDLESAAQTPRSRPRPAVDTLTASEIEYALAWQTTWLVFNRTPIADAIDAFNDRSARKLSLADPSLRLRQLGGRFRADNIEGFVHALEQTADVISERRGDEIILSAK